MTRHSETRRIPSLVAAAALALAITIEGQAQRSQPDAPATVAGRVLDATDSGAIAGADVWIRGTKLVARSDGYGRFRIDGIPPGAHAMAVRALGYDSLSRTVTLAAGAALRTEIYMVRRPHLLTQMVVHGRSMRVPRRFEEVYRRGARGWGTFITREQIDSLNPIDLKSLLVGIPTVHVSDRGIFFSRCMASLRSATIRGTPLTSAGIRPTEKNWMPQLWIDGQRVTWRDDPLELNQILRELKPSEIQAIEVYTGVARIPAEFLVDACAVIAVWTRSY